jgi:plasmid stability protein
MRTTLNLDTDVAQQLADRARRHGRSLSREANDLMRAGLLGARHTVDVAAYEPPEIDSGRPLIDITDVAEALERLEGG